jgi:hypothetical protein
MYMYMCEWETKEREGVRRARAGEGAGQGERRDERGGRWHLDFVAVRRAAFGSQIAHLLYIERESESKHRPREFTAFTGTEVKEGPRQGPQ